jgi:hypothetical protein
MRLAGGRGSGSADRGPALVGGGESGISGRAEARRNRDLAELMD